MEGRTISGSAESGRPTSHLVGCTVWTSRDLAPATAGKADSSEPVSWWGQALPGESDRMKLGKPPSDDLYESIQDVCEWQDYQLSALRGPGQCEVIAGIPEAHFMRRLPDGKGTIPPEDCRSAQGYEHCVAAATGKRWIEEYGDDKECQALLEWLDGWQPDSLELAAAKQEFDI